MTCSLYDAVIFDSDDLLTRTHEPKWLMYQALGRLLKPPITVTPELLRAVWGRPIPEIIQRLYGPGYDLADIKHLRSQIEGDYPVTAMPDTTPTLAALKAVGLPLGILSSTATEYLVPALGEASVPVSAFRHIQGGEATTAHKPHPGVFDPILRRFADDGLTGRKLYVGDDLKDWLAANVAGLDFIGVLSGLTTREEFLDHGAPIVVDRLLQTLPHILVND